jgi:hypothetical protein
VGHAADVGQDKINNLINSLTVIDNNLKLSVNLGMGAVGYAEVGGVIVDGSLDGAKITEAMLLAYQQARDEVLQYNYATATNASELFIENHVASMENLTLAVDVLADATTDLVLATSLMDTAATADTRPEQVVVQDMLATDDYTITEEKVAAYNAALDAVEGYAQSAGAFLAAANNADLTASVDSYVATNGIVIGAYTSINFIQANDEFVINWDDQGYGSGWSGYMASDFKSAEDVFGASQYIMTHGGASEEM